MIALFKSMLTKNGQTILISLYNMFSRSIDDILGHFLTSQSFVNYNIKEELAESLYEDLLR